MIVLTTLTRLPCCSHIPACLTVDIIHNLVDPSMGQPRMTEEQIRELQDTSDWAFDPVTGEHFFNWDNVTEMQYGFGLYNNPDM